MYNLIRFLIRYHAFFLFIILEIFCLWLIQRHNAYQNVKIINATNLLVGNIYNSYNETVEYLYLKNINDSLQNDLARLKSRNWPAISQNDTSAIGKQFDSVLVQLYNFIPVKVINSQTIHFNNYLLINKGTDQGIQKGMGIIGPHGIVGKVLNASSNFASGMSVLHHDFRVSALIQNNGIRGTVIWKGVDSRFAFMDYVSEPADLSIGDSIITSGASTFFPPGVLIGTISEFSLKPGRQFFNIKVELSTRFDRLHYAYIVEHRLQNEIIELENGMDNE